MNENLKKQLEDIEQRENYLEMDNVLMANMGLAINDADYAIYVIKCILHGGMSSGKQFELELKLNVGATSGDGKFDKLFAKKSLKTLNIGKQAILDLTNNYFIRALKTVIAYGNSDIIDQAAKLIYPLCSSIGKMLKHKCVLSFENYNAVASLMCTLGNTIADSVIQANKANFIGSKNIIGSFSEFVIAPLKAFISGLTGLIAGSSVQRDIRMQVKETYKKLAKMA